MVYIRVIVASVAAVLFCAASVAATSIVAVRNNDEIVIGADSKTTLVPAYDRGDVRESIAKCKIVQTGDVFFASAGSAGIGPVGSKGDCDPEFDLKAAIMEGLSGGGVIAERVERMEKLLALNLTRIATRAREANAEFFFERFVRNPVHTIIIAGRENEELVLMVRTFRLIVSPSGDLSFEIGRFTCPGDCQTPLVTVFEGRTDAIRNYLQEHEAYLDITSPDVAVRDLVGLEIATEPASVGPPVDILRLTRGGAEWVQKKALCPDIRHVVSVGETATARTTGCDAYLLSKEKL